ncbi:hypothetical protein F4779DRAFT_252616 [Xylariaceae sp. FL0662B]|nr:hypothetical protein F4779DRAFT_252616 [Xylariaceae sp. FL0662B]
MLEHKLQLGLETRKLTSQLVLLFLGFASLVSPDPTRRYYRTTGLTTVCVSSYKSPRLIGKPGSKSDLRLDILLRGVLGSGLMEVELVSLIFSSSKLGSPNHGQPLTAPSFMMLVRSTCFTCENRSSLLAIEPIHKHLCTSCKLSQALWLSMNSNSNHKQSLELQYSSYSSLQDLFTYKK